MRFVILSSFFISFAAYTSMIPRISFSSEPPLDAEPRHLSIWCTGSLYNEGQSSFLDFFPYGFNDLGKEILTSRTLGSKFGDIRIKATELFRSRESIQPYEISISLKLEGENPVISTSARNRVQLKIGDDQISCYVNPLS